MTATIPYTPDRAMSYWPTPADVADDLLYNWMLEPWHGLGDGIRVLEPSAGEGHLAQVIREHLPDAHITAVEPSPERATTLRSMPDVVTEVVQASLEEYLVTVAMSAMAGTWQPFHLVAMNPPFTLDGRPEAWAEHILAVYHDPYLVAPGGTIGAITPRILMTGKSRLVRQVRDLFGPCRGGVEAAGRRAFTASGTGIGVALMWAYKPFLSEGE